MHTVEWPKRSLPHAHILIWLCDKIEATEIDHLISAEIPDPSADPELYEIVTTNLIHGPCGSHYNYTNCDNSDGKCTRQYPRDFVAKPLQGAMVIHCTGEGVPLREDLQPCSLHQETDAAIFGSTQEDSVDEIQDFLAGCVISSTKGPWHIFSFVMFLQIQQWMWLRVLKTQRLQRSSNFVDRTSLLGLYCTQTCFYTTWGQKKRTPGLGGSAGPTSRAIQALIKTPHSEGYSRFPHRDRNVFTCDSFCTKLVVQRATITYGRLMEFYVTLFVRPASVSAFSKTTASGMPQWLKQLF
ncbi:unnamed protein product [Acanthosepion pharaonis]|uniref:Helitron helicase-like domain-containing protein n=1 Tax=Acanthosepion pharaonis TaxID=158019 RepID=A0A812CAW9_ACAPH|nr:unnamed protein product [Sepia pharaonis]